MTPRPRPKQSPPVDPDFGRFAGLGLRFVLTVALFGLAGWWADARVGWSPWLLVAGILLGAVVSFVAVVRAVPPARNLDLPPLTDADFSGTDTDAADTDASDTDPRPRDRSDDDGRPRRDRTDPRSR